MAAAFTSPAPRRQHHPKAGRHSRPSACSAGRIGCSGGGIWKRDGTGSRRRAIASPGHFGLPVIQASEEVRSIVTTS